MTEPTDELREAIGHAIFTAGIGHMAKADAVLATPAFVALRAKADAADRVRELADDLEADNRRWPDAPVVGLRADLADRIRRALDGVRAC